LSDEEFQKAVMARFDTLDGRFDAVDSRMDAIDVRFDRVDRRMDALSARLDDVENRIDALGVRVDHSIRTMETAQGATNEALRETRQGIDALHSLGRRVTRLENPDE
jgi:methyl-accepting chemotaxis protein